MKNQLRRLTWLLISTCLAGSLAVPLSAQELAGNDLDPDNDEIFELSPFVVGSQSQQGYMATETLAGTRIRTQLKDIGSAVSILTEDFMDDIAASDDVDLLVFAPNTEVVGMAGNFSGTTGRALWVNYGSSRQLNSQTRIRGLAEADKTRNYFGTAIPFDSYNVDRVVVNRGSNSFLFGLGSPAGIINYQLKRAQMTDFGSVEVLLDDFGTNRFILDVNEAVIDDVLTVRAILMDSSRRYQQEEAFDDQERAYLTGEYKPWKGATIRGNFEYGNLISSKPSIDPPRDRLTWWWHPEVNQVSHNPAVIDYRDRNQLTVSLVDGGNNPALFYSDNNSSMPDPSTIQWAMSNSRGGFNVTNPNAARANRMNNYRYRYAGIHNSRVIRQYFSAQNQPQPDWWSPGDPVPAGWSRDNATAEMAARSLVLNEQILDPGIFDFYNHQLSGGNDRQTGDVRAYNLTFEQLGLDGDIGIELAYDRQEYDSSDFEYLQGQRGRSITVDVNEVDHLGNPNPNFGRPLIGSRTRLDISESEDETFRATGFYRFDWTKANDGWLGEALGRWITTVVYSKDDAEFMSKGGRVAHMDAAYAAKQFRNNSFGSNEVQLSTAHYIGPSLAGLSSPEGVRLSALHGGRHRIPDAIPDLTYWDYAAGGFVTETVPIISYWDDPTVIGRTQGSGAFASQTEVESISANLQAYLFSDLIVGTIGWREDTIESTTVAASERDEMGTLTYEDLTFSGPADLDETESTVAYSLVAHLPRNIRENLPWGMDASVHYSESENFRATGARRNIFGKTLPSAGGETEEIGFTLRFFEEKLIARFNWYETSQNNDTDDAMTSIIGGILKTQRDTMRENPPDWLDQVGWKMLPEVNAALGFNPTPLDSRQGHDVDSTGSTAGMVSVADTISEGFEMELVYNPLPNWRISFNISQQEARIANRGRSLEPVIEFIQQNWAFGTPAGDNLYEAGPPDQVPQEGGTLGQRTALQVLNNWTLQKALDGLPVTELREWRWNLVTNYTFVDGFMEGWNIGAGIRWEDEVGIGYPYYYSEEIDDFLPIVDQPFWGEAEDHYDAWIGYTTTIMNGKYDLSVQLNIKNIDDDDDLIKVAAQPVAGLRDIYRIPEGRRFILTMKLGF